MEREAGGGIRMRNTCRSMADSCQCMAKKHYNIKKKERKKEKINKSNGIYKKIKVGL